jgi:hypothetical protein
MDRQPFYGMRYFTIILIVFGLKTGPTEVDIILFRLHFANRPKIL